MQSKINKLLIMQYFNHDNIFDNIILIIFFKLVILYMRFFYFSLFFGLSLIYYTYNYIFTYLIILIFNYIY